MFIQIRVRTQFSSTVLFHFHPRLTLTPSQLPSFSSSPLLTVDIIQHTECLMVIEIGTEFRWIDQWDGLEHPQRFLTT